MNTRLSLLFISFLLTSSTAFAYKGQNEAKPMAGSTTSDSKGKDISEFLLDKSAGQISASTMVGVNNSVITNIQNAQDIVLAFRPSDSDSKSGFGISITPARTSITPMSTSTYYSGGALSRMLGSLTVSYASKEVEISNVNVTKRAISFDTLYYFDKKMDPVIAGFDALQQCAPANPFWEAMQKDALDNNRASFTENTKKYSTALQTCLDEMKKSLPWNAARISLAVGMGEVSGGGIRTQSMGKALVLNLMIPIGVNGAVQPMYRRTWRELDLATIGNGDDKSSSNLFASRFTYGLQDAGRLQLLAEISNLKKSTLAQSESFFKNAIGIDYAITKGIWLQLRYGNSKARTSDTFEKKGMVSLQFNPSCALSEKCGE